MSKSTLGAVALALLASTSIPAQAGALTAEDILTQFNGVVWNNFTTGDDVEGRLVAENLNGGATLYESPNPLESVSSYQAVNAINLNACSSCNVNNGGSVNWVSSKGAVSFNFNGGGSLQQNNPSFAISDFTTPLNALVTQLGGLTQNSMIDATDNNNVDFEVSPNSQGIAVFNVTGSALQDYAGVEFTNIDSAKTIIIDVTGSVGFSFSQAFNYVNLSGTDQTYLNDHVIWNFEDAGSVSIETIHGALLAEDATVSNTSPIEGLLYAENFNGGGELHDYPFLGVLPGAAAAPEPSTWALMALGFAGLGFVGRRASRKAAFAA